MAAKTRTGDLLALGMILISLALFFQFISDPMNILIKLLGLIGSVIVFIVELVFVWQSWVKRK